MKKNNYLIIGLTVLLVAAIVIIIVMQVNNSTNRKLQTTYQLGVKGGYEFAVKQLMEQLTTCQPVPVFADNVTLNAVAVECLQQPRPPSQPAGFEEKPSQEIILE